MSAIPGPRGLPIVGCHWELCEDPLKFLRKAAADYGDVCGFSLFGIPCVLVSHPTLIAEVLIRNMENTKKARDYQELRLVFGNGLIVADNGPWRPHRNLMQPDFAHARIAEHGPAIERRTQARLATWKQGKTVDIAREMSAITVEIVGETLFGVELKEKADEIADALDAFMQRYAEFFSKKLRLPLKFPTPSSWRAWKATDRLRDVVAEILAQGRRSKDENNLLAHLLKAEKQGETPLTEQEIADELMTLMIAGHETTSLALTYAIVLGCRHREVWQRLNHEAKAGPVSASAAPGKISYVRQVVEEAMRLYPPAWGIAREALTDIKLGDYVVPKGTQVMMCAAVLHRDKRFFDGPDEFIPERFATEARKQLPKHAYFPFGLGPRSCIGAQFALFEAERILPMIARSFDLSIVSGGDLDVIPAVTLRPKSVILAHIDRLAA
jgi:cytochrome P450